MLSYISNIICDGLVDWHILKNSQEKIEESR